MRFVKLNGTVYAVKETRERIAEREYDLLRALERIDFPAVEAVAIVADRIDRRRRAAGAGADHPAPAVLAAVPGAVLAHAAARRR